jgi:hypothetical protein
MKPLLRLAAVVVLGTCLTGFGGAPTSSSTPPPQNDPQPERKGADKKAKATPM